MTVFLMGDGVTAAMKGQKTPDGYYKLDRMLGAVVRNQGAILCCGTCMDARGIAPDDGDAGAERERSDQGAEAAIPAQTVLNPGDNAVGGLGAALGDMKARLDEALSPGRLGEVVPMPSGAAVVIRSNQNHAECPSR